MIKDEMLAAEQLDIDFTYPEEYKIFIQNPDVLSKTPWWLIGDTKGFFNTCFEVTNYQYKSTKLLVPFAKSDQSNILACFDQSHKVWLTSCNENCISNTNWDDRYFLKDFSAWLDRVLNDNMA